MRWHRLCAWRAARYLPFFSASDCSVIPPYGEAYTVGFRPSPSFPPYGDGGGGAGPNGTFPACNVNNNPCCMVTIDGMGSNDTTPGDTYTLSAFDGDGIATGQMNTNQGIVPLVVKSCP
jgi:hypothetical protein